MSTEQFSTQNTNVIWTNSKCLDEFSPPKYHNSISETNPKQISIDVILPYTNKNLAEQCVNILIARSGIPIRVIAVFDDTQLGFIKIVNSVFKKTDAKFIAYLAQDAFPGRYWMKVAIETLIRNKKTLLAFNDGKWFGQLAAFGLVSRKWAEQNYETRSLFFEQYHSHYADTELSIIAENKQMLTFNPNSILIEVDFDKEKKPTNPKDKALYAQRVSNGFNQTVSNQKLLTRFR